MADSLTLSVTLGGRLKSGFDRMFGDASKSVGKLGRTVKKTHDALNQVNAYQRNAAALDTTRTKLGETQRKVMGLRKALKSDPSSAKLGKQLKATRRDAIKLSSALENQRAKLRGERQALRKAGIATNDLNHESERLTRTWNKQKRVLGERYRLLEKSGRIRDRMGKNTQRLTRTAIAGGLAAWPVARWIGDSAKWNYQLRLIGNTGELTDKQLVGLKTTIMATSKAANRSVGDVTEGVDTLISAGIGLRNTRGSILAISRTAAAENANINDLSNATVALINNLRIKPKGLAGALDILTQAGKEGNVELKAMSQYLPTLSAGFGSILHMHGNNAVASMAAALEVARKGTGDAQSAANNLQNFLAKVMSPQTLRNAKQNFGVDLAAVIKNAQASGANPFDAAIQSVMKMTGGDAVKMGKLFQDMQVQNFLRPMLAHWAEYKRIRDKALDASGVVDADFAKMGKTTKQRLDTIGQTWDRFHKAVGSALGHTFVTLGKVIKPLLSGMTTFVRNNPHLVGAIGALVAGIIGLRIAVLASKIAFGGLNLGIIKFLPGASHLSAAFSGIGGMGGIASKGIGLVTAAMRGLNLTFLMSPIGLVIGALVAGAFLVYKFWSPIKAFFKGVWQGLKAAFVPVLQSMGKLLAPLAPAWHAIARAIGMAWGWVKKLFTPFQATKKQLHGATSAGRIFGRVVGTVFRILTLPIRLALHGVMALGKGIGWLAGWTAVHVGKATDSFRHAWGGAIGFVKGLWHGLKKAVALVIGWIVKKIDWIVKKWNAVKGAFGSAWKKVSGGIGNAWHWATGGDDHHTSSPARVAAAAALAGAVAAPGAMALPAQAGGTTNDNRTTIVVHAAPGMNETHLAHEVRRQLDERDQQRAAQRRSRLGDLE